MVQKNSLHPAAANTNILSNYSSIITTKQSALTEYF